MTRTTAVALFAAIVLALGGGFLGGRASNSGEIDSARSERDFAVKLKVEAENAQSAGNAETTETAIDAIYEGLEAVKFTCIMPMSSDDPDFYEEEIKGCRTLERKVNEAGELLGRDPWQISAALPE